MGLERYNKIWFDQMRFMITKCKGILSKSKRFPKKKRHEREKQVFSIEDTRALSKDTCHKRCNTIKIRTFSTNIKTERGPKYYNPLLAVVKSSYE